mmetsp:Transcript_112406/g.350287  ORF Transcript_112406/g.350287 Transcript_112406/m.350287 type:complete len:363 (-) Transcript_112406:49-1137(-)
MDAQGVDRDPAGECCCCDGRGTVAGYGVCPLCNGEAAPPEPDLAAVAAAVASGLPRVDSAAGVGGPCPARPAPSGDGTGLFADRPLAPGDLVCGEVPLLTVLGTEAIRQLVVEEHSASGGSTSEMRVINELYVEDVRLLFALARALEQLAPEMQDAFLALADSFPGGPAFRPGVWVCIESPQDCRKEFAGRRGHILRSQPEGGRAAFVIDVGGMILHGIGEEEMEARSAGTLGGIFLTNAVSEKARDVSRVYHLTSRINHACRPNAVAIEHDEARYVLAASAIRSGDEVTISYIEDYCHPERAQLRTRVREIANCVRLDPTALLLGLFRQQLFVKWGFWCFCRRCAPLAEASSSALRHWESI